MEVKSIELRIYAGQGLNFINLENRSNWGQRKDQYSVKHSLSLEETSGKEKQRCLREFYRALTKK
jgi:hypothetical protein